MTDIEIAAQVERIRGSVKEETVRRLLERLRKGGHVSVTNGAWKVLEE